MAFTPTDFDDSVNVTPHSTIGAFARYVVAIVVIFTAVYFALGVAVDIAARVLPRSWEAAVFSPVIDKIAGQDKETATNTSYTQYLRNLTNTITTRLPDESTPVTVWGIESKIDNAAALPGGTVIFSRGLYDRIDSENSVVFILGHERGHVLGRHPLRGFGRGVLLVLGFSLMGDFASNIASKLFIPAFAHYSQAQEHVADEAGLRALVALYGHAGGMRETFAVLEKLANEKGGEGSPLFASHPRSSARIAHLEEIIEREGITTGPLTPKRKVFYEGRSSESLHLRGDSDLLSKGVRVSVVGSREASSSGLARARKLSRLRVERGIIVVSGLARGIDTAAHTAALQSGGKTISILGTSLSQFSTVENRQLQEEIGRDHLLVSQFPEGKPVQKGNFPLRNRLMALISDATVIIEAQDGSGTTHQGWEALRLARPLWIPSSVVEEASLKWPKEFLNYGARILSDDSLDEFNDLLPEPAWNPPHHVLPF